MKYLSITSRVVRPSIYRILTAAAVSVIGGCAASDKDPDPAVTSSSAVTVNDASRSSPTGSETAQFDTIRAFPTGEKASSIILLEAIGPQTIRANHEGTYQIKVSNLTDMSVKNVILSSTNPNGFQPISVQGSTTKPSDGAMQYAVGDLGPKESRTITMTGMATKVGMVDTCYSVQYNPPTLCTALQITNPAINLAVDAPADTDICKPVTYRYVVKNTGTGTAHNVTLEEQLPDGLSTADGKPSLTANLGDIAQGDSRTVTANLKASKTGKLTGSALARSEGDASAPVSTVTAVHAPMLAVTVTGGSSDYVGKQVSYKIVVTNKGDAAANNAKLQIAHPADSIGAVSANGVDANGMISLGTLAPNENREVDAMASSNQGGTLTVVANASVDCAPAVSQSAQTQFNTIPALLLETVDEADPVRVGENVIYDIKVTNQGSGPDSNVNIKAAIPDGEQYLSSEGPTQPEVKGAQMTFPTVPVLQPKESVTWKVTLKATKAADVQFKTSATSDGIKAGAEKTEPTKLY